MSATRQNKKAKVLDKEPSDKNAKLIEDNFDAFFEKERETWEGEPPSQITLMRSYFKYLREMIKEWQGVDVEEVKSTSLLGNKLYELVRTKTKHVY